MCAILRVARQADDRAAGARIPIRRAEADERRHEIHAVGVVHLRHQLLDVRRRLDRLQAIAQPLHRRAGDEHRPFERVGDLAADLPRHRRQQPLLRRHRLGAGVEQHEAAGAVGVLRRARLEAGLAEERRLLIAGIAGDGNRPRRTAPDRSGRRPRSTTAPPAASRAARRAASAARRPTACVWMLNSSVRLALLTSVTWTLPPVSRQIRNVSMVPNSTSPRAARARRPSNESSRCLIFVPEKYASTTRPVFFRNVRLVPVGLQPIANRRRDAALPDDGVGDRLAGRLVPQHGRLALVGDADGGEVGGGDAGLR